MRSLLVCWVVLHVAIAHAERWPVRIYSTADGLANNRVDRATRDSRGFLWFATLEGVSRFDGHDFVNYGTRDGLPSAAIDEVLATHDGRIWVATTRGLAWLDPDERTVAPRFHVVGNEEINCLFEDPGGVLWGGSVTALVRIERAADVAIVVPVLRTGQILAIAYDPRDRSLWLGGNRGLMHRHADGALETYRVAPPGDLDDRVFGVALDRAGRIWLGHVDSKVLAIPTRPGEPIAAPGASLWELAPQHPDWLRDTPTGWARRGFVEDSHGTMWIGTTLALVRYADGAFEEIDASRIGGNRTVAPMLEDPDGNLWFGSDGLGLFRLARSGLVGYGTGDGLAALGVYGFVQPPDGPLYAIEYVVPRGHTIARRDGEHFSSVVPRIATELLGAWGWNQTALIDRDGRWWLPTGHGVVRFPALARFEDLATTDPRVYGEALLPGRDVFRLYEDRKGDIWIATLSKPGLARWDRASDRIVQVGDDWRGAEIFAFAEDRSGALWIGCGNGVLVRVRDGALHRYGPADGLTTGSLEALLVDRAGRLWIASNGGGLLRIDDPTAATLHVTAYTRAQGLASDQALALTDDAFGRIYTGTSHGVDRFDPATGAIDHLSTVDGLPSDYINVAFRDRDDTLWFGSKGAGAARLAPTADQARSAPVYITRLDVAGTLQPLALAGEREVAAVEVGPDEDRIEIGYTTPSFETASPPQFEFRLDDEPWSPPLAERVVRFAKLAPGPYRFAVRIAGDPTQLPATVELVVLPPIWRRWWFVAVALALAGVLAYLAYRRRLAQLVAIERVRTRIATDLHDDLGSGLSRIAILSELGEVGEIGKNARELVDVAADIVWSTDPRRDDVGSLLVRLRGFAADVLESRGIACTITAPDDPARIKLGPDRRRHLYLVLKEAIHNAAKHSRATRVDVALRHDRGIVATVRDDGCGFDEAALERRGNGLANMRARATEAGGTLTIRSTPGGGTEIELRVA